MRNPLLKREIKDEEMEDIQCLGFWEEDDEQGLGTVTTLIFYFPLPPHSGSAAERATDSTAESCSIKASPTGSPVELMSHYRCKALDDRFADLTWFGSFCEKMLLP